LGDIAVFSCVEAQLALAERSVITKAGEVLDHYKWAEPRFLPLSIGTMVRPGTVAAAARNILCNNEFKTPLVGKSDPDWDKIISLSSTTQGEGEIFYMPLSEKISEVNTVRPTIIIKFHEDWSLSDVLTKDTVLEDPPQYGYLVGKMEMYCSERKFIFSKIEYYDRSRRLVYIMAVDRSQEITRSEMQAGGPYDVLRRIACTTSEVRK
jgi:hypothetical protein